MSLFSFIKSNISIADVVSEYVTVKKAGIYLKGTCPFHHEKTASFTVSPHRQIYYCFGCHEGGDVISFIAKIENCSQFEAAQHLAERYNLDIPESIEKPTSNKPRPTGDQKKRYFELCKTVADWCAHNLQSSTAPKKYLDDRGFGDASARRFDIGYFPGGPRAIKNLIATASKHGFLASDLLDAHILSEGKSMLYSPFEERIIFPIKDHLGRNCGFGGRVYKSHDERAKYYNSRENSYFAKGSLLFGLNQAKKSIQEKGYAVLVEGYTDCIAMAQQGILHCVATLGTACTEDHLKIMSRYVNQVYVLYDGDNAGQKAILRLTELAWNVNLELKVVCLPAGEDPASYCGSGGNIHALIESAKDIFQFMISMVSKDFGTKTLNEKLKVTDKLISIINNIDDPIKQDILLSQAAQTMNVARESLAQQVSHKKVQPSAELEPTDELLATTSKLERKLFAAIMMDFALLDKAEAHFLIDYFAPSLKEVVDELTIKRNNDNELDFATFFETLDGPKKLLTNRLLLQSNEKESQGTFELLLQEFHKKHWKTVVSNVKQKITTAQQAGHTDQVQQLIHEFQDLKKKMLKKGEQS